MRLRRGSRVGAIAVGVLALLVVIRRAVPRAPRSPAGATSVAVQPAPAPGTAPARSPASAASREVDRVVDGDTILLTDGERVRLLGINTPELHHEDASVRAVALDATRALADLVNGAHVELIPGDPPRDRYGRLLAYVETTTNGERDDVGATLLERGLATTYPTAHPRAVAYMTLARAARDAQLGLWAPEPRLAMGLVPASSPSVREARAHVGESCRIEGTWRSGRRTPTVQVARIEDGGASLNLVIFPTRYDELPLEMVSTWEGRRVAVEGRVESYRDAPQIKLEDPFQVEPLGAKR